MKDSRATNKYHSQQILTLHPPTAMNLAVIREHAVVFELELITARCGR